MSPQPSTVQAISRALAAELGSRAEWDEPACLYAIRLQADQVHLQPYPIAPATWTIGRPPEVLAHITRAAELAARHPGALRYDDLYGTAFRHQEWEPDMRDPGSLVESRLIAAVDRTGTTYSARQQRGQDHVLTDILPPGSSLRLDRKVPGALHRLTAALTGVQLLRPEPPEAGS